jgi:hypothetical protein
MNGVFSDNYLYSMLWWQFGRLSRNMLIERNWLIYVGNLEFYACDSLTGPNVLVRSNVYTGQLIVNCPGVESVNNLKITPAGQHVFVRPNQYSDTNDLKVGHVVVYTFNGAPNVQINVSNLLETGARYSVRDVQDYYGTPVATGAYTGSISVVLPDTNSPSPRVDRPAIVNWPVVARHTPKEFNCFVIERLDAQLTPPNPPTPPTNIVVITNYVWVTNYQVVNVTNAFTNTVWQFISPVMTTNLATP